MIVLFTDFGTAGPYLGQMEAVLRLEAPGKDVVRLFSDAPAHDPLACAYLLPAYVGGFPEGTVFLCVVDPGVGSDRPAVVLEADGRFFVGPGNGLFELVARRAKGKFRLWDILWRPKCLSSSFHGRDLFAPIAARIACGDRPEKKQWASESPLTKRSHRHWPDDLFQIIYVDSFGNAITGIRSTAIADNLLIVAGGKMLNKKATFSSVPIEQAFWYNNSSGLIEIAVNRGRADRLLGLAPGDKVSTVAM